MQTPIPVPEYRLREWQRHLKRIVDNTVCDPADTCTVNALRLARRDLRNLEKYLPKKS